MPRPFLFASPWPPDHGFLLLAGGLLDPGVLFCTNVLYGRLASRPYILGAGVPAFAFVKSGFLTPLSVNCP